MIHHPPVRGAVAQHKRLFGIGNFQKTISSHGAELILHGHSHEPTLYWIGGKGKQTVPVVGVAAGGQAVGGSHPAAQWNLLEISGEPEAWVLRLTRRGLSGPTLPVGELSSICLVGDNPSAAENVDSRAANLRRWAEARDQPIPQRHDRGDEPNQCTGRHKTEPRQEGRPSAALHHVGASPAPRRSRPAMAG